MSTGYPAITIVVDIGTGSVKAECFDEKGGAVARTVQTYSPRSGGRSDEQSHDEWDPEVWYEACIEGVRELGTDNDFSAVRTIVCAGQMQNVIPVASSQALGPAILYFAQRPSSRFDDWLEHATAERIVALTHNTPDPAGFPAKLLWLEHHRRSQLSGAHAILCGAHDYLAYRLTSTVATDPTTASTTGLFDPVRGCWARELFEGLPIDYTMMAPVVSADHDDGTLTAEAAATLTSFGIPSTVRVVHGAGDVGSSVLAMERSGMRRSIYLGTSGWVQDVAELSCPGDPNCGVFNLRHPVLPRLIRVAPLLTAGGAFDWFVRNVAGEEGSPENEVSARYETLSSRAAAYSPEGCRVVFLPHLAGERSPFKDPHATGVFLGLRRDSTQGELFRAVEEGVAFAVRSIMEALDRSDGASGERLDPILLSGGGSAVKSFPQLLSTITDRTLALADGARFGGARALLSLASTPPEVVAGPSTSREEVPLAIYHPAGHYEAYERKYRVYRRTYIKVKELMEALVENSLGGMND